MTTATAIENPTNGAKEIIESGLPYMATVTISGTADLLFHAWNVEAVETKGKAAKGSKEKKSDNIESYVYRDGDGMLSIPGENMRGSIILAAKFKQDPRSPRKSAMDLYKAGVIAMTTHASLGTDKWDYESRKRVTVQRSGITRTRPAMKAGWRCTFDFLITLPEYIQPDAILATINDAGRLVGLCDFRPTYGRFQVVSFTVNKA